MTDTQTSEQAVVLLPKTDAGNDPNDWRDDPDAVEQMEAAVAEAVKKDRDNKKTITVGKASEESGVVTALLQNPTEDNVALAFANHYVVSSSTCMVRASGSSGMVLAGVRTCLNG